MTTQTIDGRRMYFREAGAGTPVVLLHGSASSGAQWKAATDELRGTHRVITPDLPGYGGSENGTSASVATLAGVADPIIEMISGLGEPVHLVGHSFGAAVAIKIAMTAGHMIRSLTLFEPALFHVLRDGSADDQALYREIRAIEGVLAASAQDDNAPAGMSRFIDFWNGDGTWERLPAHIRDMYASDIGKVLRDFAVGNREIWSVGEAARIACPVSAYMGLESPAVAQRTVEVIAEAIPQATLTMIADADHIAPMTHAPMLAPAMKRHFAAAEAAEADFLPFTAKQAA